MDRDKIGRADRYNRYAEEVKSVDYNERYPIQMKFYVEEVKSIKLLIYTRFV